MADTPRCGGEGHLAKNFGVLSPGRPEIVPCPGCVDCQRRYVIRRVEADLEPLYFQREDEICTLHWVVDVGLAQVFTDYEEASHLACALEIQIQDDADPILTVESKPTCVVEEVNGPEPE